MKPVARTGAEARPPITPVVDAQTAPVPTIRPATIDDRAFLEDMRAVAVDWRPGSAVRPVADVMAEPSLANYVAGWGSDDDVGFVAVGDRPGGAVWWLFLPEHDPGYGFVDVTIPELAIGVVDGARGQGVGTRLLTALVDEARQRALPGLSLSVEIDNQASALYRRLGFDTIAEVDGSLTMVLRLP